MTPPWAPKTYSNMIKPSGTFILIVGQYDQLLSGITKMGIPCYTFYDTILGASSISEV